MKKLASRSLFAVLMIVLAVAGFITACSSSDDDALIGPVTNDASSPKAVTQTVGAGGGTISTGTVTLDIPPGALPANTSITVTESTMLAPAYKTLTPIYTFAPDGLVFAKPVTVTIAYRGATTGVAVLWSRPNVPGSYDALPTSFTASAASTAVLHFSSGFVGSPNAVPEVDSGTGTIVTDASTGSDADTIYNEGGTCCSEDVSVTPTPTFSLPPGEYQGDQDVMIADTESGATIFYTLDGTQPNAGSSVYAGPIHLVSTTTIRAIATAPTYSPSAAAVAVYTITPVDAGSSDASTGSDASTVTDASTGSDGGPTTQAAAPTFSLPEGPYQGDQDVSLATTTAGATIFYTLDGTNPTPASLVYSTPLHLVTTTTIRAVAMAPGFLNSDYSHADYMITQVAATPSCSPTPGTYAGQQEVMISTTTAGADIFYTTDGTNPTIASLVYTSPLTLVQTTTIRAMAAKSGFTNSTVGVCAYTITVP